jgi:hypothetical protein
MPAALQLGRGLSAGATIKALALLRAHRCGAYCRSCPPAAAGGRRLLLYFPSVRTAPVCFAVAGDRCVMRLAGRPLRSDQSHSRHDGKRGVTMTPGLEQLEQTEAIGNRASERGSSNQAQTNAGTVRRDAPWREVKEEVLAAGRRRGTRATGGVAMQRQAIPPAQTFAAIRTLQRQRQQRARPATPPPTSLSQGPRSPPAPRCDPAHR